jgi:virulence-associated protein VapD
MGITMKIQLEAVKSDEEKIIRIRRNGDGKVTQIQAYQELFSDLKNRFSTKFDWASIFVLYDLRTSLFWWQYAKTNNVVYAKQDIDTHLSQLGYLEEDNGVYVYNKTARKFKQLIYLSNNNIVKFSLKWATLSIREALIQHDGFEQAYKQIILKIKESLNRGGEVNDITKIIHLRKYIDDNFFYIPNYSGIVDVGELIEVKQQDSQWLIVLERTERREGYDKTRVTIVLNENYEVVDLFGANFIKQSNPLYLSFNNERYEILELMRCGYTVQEIASYLGKDNKTISQLIRHMLEEGLVEKIGYGKYKPIVKLA